MKQFDITLSMKVPDEYNTGRVAAAVALALVEADTTAEFDIRRIDTEALDD